MRSALLMFIEDVIVLDAAISQIAAEHLGGQPVLFRDCDDKLHRQLEMATRLSEHFNCLGVKLEGIEINLEELRDSLRPQIDEQASNWFNLARLTMLSEFGPEAVMQGLLKQILRPTEPIGETAAGRITKAISDA